MDRQTDLDTGKQIDRQTDIDTDKQRLGSSKYNEGNCHKNIYKKTTRQK